MKASVETARERYLKALRQAARGTLDVDHQTVVQQTRQRFNQALADYERARTSGLCGLPVDFPE